MIAAVPEMPSDGPGPLALITGILTILVVCFFAFWILGGYRFFIGPPESWPGLWGPTLTTLLLLVSMFVALGLFRGAVWLEERERDAAWERYDEYLIQQEATTEAP